MSLPSRNLRSFPVKLGIIALALVSRMSFAAEAKLPSQLRATSMYLFTGTVTVELKGDTLTYTLANREGTETATFKPTPEQWKEFRAVLDDIQIWQWRKSYRARGVGSESAWSLDIEYRGRQLHTSGGGRPDSKEYSRYQKAIENLVSGRKFE